MGVSDLKCSNCGATIEEINKDIYQCPKCGSKFKFSAEINNTTVNNYETTIKNYYGVAAKSEKQIKKINDYLSLIV